MTKDTLRQYRWLNIEVRQLEEQLCELNSRRMKITTSLTSDPRGGSVIVDRQAEITSRMVDLEKSINEKCSIITSQQRAIEQAIATLPVRERALMREYYVRASSWNIVATVMGCEERHVYRIHGEALKMLE